MTTGGDPSWPWLEQNTMDDRDYIKLKPALMGFRYVGTVPDEARPLLRRAYDDLKRTMGDAWDEQIAAKEICWMNIWQDDEEGDAMELSDKTLAAEFHAWCATASGQFAEQGAIMDGYGFVVNPIGSKPQVWHVDYTTDAAAIWIPLTQFTDKNATQFITLPEGTPDEALEKVASHVDEVDVEALARSVDHFQVHQIVAKPMSVLYMGRGTIHRGISNSGEENRISFYISLHFIRDYSVYPYAADERSEQAVVNFND
ncbi:MAG: hypothetical protein Q8O26_06285 [Phreatobacter sp.]|uniref:hypothetical protein n=1 Tax=Phreatobacter sp. TaxID=1966341 RepID=UPI002734223B|nr:hypothetical protein [Phreatobacter sp.]MDP2801475.1 hypothetical protein [Phreatobacter sp.]